MLFRTTLALTLAKFLVAVIPIVMLPLITEHLSKTQFSKYSLSLSVLALLLPLICLNVQTGQRVRVSQGKNNKIQNRLSIIIMSITTLITLSIVCLAPDSFIEVFNRKELIIIVFGAFATGIITSVETFYVLEHKPCKVAGMIIVSQIAIWFGAYLIMLKDPLWWIKIGPLIFIGALYFVKVMLLDRHRNYVISNSFDQGKKLLKIGLNAVPLSFFNIALLHIDKVLITFIFDVNQIFIYMALSSVVAILSFLLQGSIIGFDYIYYQQHAKQEFFKNIFLTSLCLLFFILSGIVFYIFHEEIISFMISKEIIGDVKEIILFLIIASISRAILVLFNPAIIIWGIGPLVAIIQASIFFSFLFLGIDLNGETSVVSYAKAYSQAMIMVLISTLFFLIIMGAKKHANTSS